MLGTFKKPRTSWNIKGFYNMMNKHNFFVTRDDSVENLNGIKGRC